MDLYSSLLSTATIWDSILVGGSQRQLGQLQSTALNQNARFSELNAADALKRGEREARLVKRQANQIAGTQRASYAAQGVDVGSGTALDVQNQTDELGNIDAETVRTNAWREAWGYRVQAADQRSQANVARITGESQAGATLLTGGIRSASYLGSLGSRRNKVSNGGYA